MLASKLFKHHVLKNVQNLLQTIPKSWHFQIPSTIRHLSSIKYDNVSGNFAIEWSNGSQSNVPYEFVRDNCQCKSCYDIYATQSLIVLPDVLKEAKQGVQQAKFEGDSIIIHWNSGHSSKFKSDWLQKRVYKGEDFDDVRRSKCVLWGSEHRFQDFDFNKLMKDDKYLLNWMTVLSTEGINVLKDAPREPDQLKALAKRGFGSLYNTMYGDIFTVKEKPKANNLAYKSGYLALHTDQPYYVYQPGIQFLHCIVGSPKNQGVNQLVDGFKVATDLREQNPDAFEILTTLKFPYEQRGSDMFGSFILADRKTPIGLNEYGDINRISHNYPSRATFMNMAAEETKKLYQAAGIFQGMMYDSKYLMEYQLQEGDILCFHNLRVLHGRTPYDSSVSHRWLEGAYGSWDDLYARMRAIQEELNNSEN